MLLMLMLLQLLLMWLLLVHHNVLEWCLNKKININVMIWESHISMAVASDFNHIIDDIQGSVSYH